MVYFFHENLRTSSTNTLIKKYSKVKHDHRGHSKRMSLAKYHFFWVIDIRFFGCEPFPYVTFCYFFFVNLPSSHSQVTHILNGPILLSYHNMFSNKVFVDNSQWNINSGVIFVTLADLPVSFPKSCSEQLFCKEHFSGTCH